MVYSIYRDGDNNKNARANEVFATWSFAFLMSGKIWESYEGMFIFML